MTSDKSTAYRKELDDLQVHGQVTDQHAARALAEFATRNAARRQRKVWSRRVTSWDQHGSAGLTKVTAAVIAAASVAPGARVVDLGCGNGQVGLPLARNGANVLAVDVSPAMIESLQAEARRQRLTRLHGLATPIEELMLPLASVDLVVSSYALHHLRDADKARLIRSASGWLRPGGRIVIADMMFGRGASSRDKEIIRSKVAALAKKGIGGWWRIAKNAVRYQLRVQERPVSADAWKSMLTSAGFTAITETPIVAEACMVTARLPERPEPRGSAQ
jgi:2-polyprenyl-3-methyl-5-hydroxy-6-metoxy-1,4-benzoquinol methylase